MEQREYGSDEKKVQVLVATMGQKDFSKLSQMNIQTDVIYMNQASTVSYMEQSGTYGTAKMITTNTRGVGINRNLGIFYSDGDYLLFSDDDLRYEDGYGEIIREAFGQLPDADGIVFNIDSRGEKNFVHRENSKIVRLGMHNSLNYGAVRLAVRRSAIVRENIQFSLNFGGGTVFSAGEDTLFICSMLKKGLKLYTYPKTIASLNQDSASTWFSGYNAKYYYDKGAFYGALTKHFSRLALLQDLLRHRRYLESGMSFSEVYRLGKEGISGFRSLRPYCAAQQKEQKHKCD